MIVKYIVELSNHLCEPVITGKVSHADPVFKVVHVQVTKFHEKLREAQSFDDMIQQHDDQ